jgi:hypothetical protein
VAATAVNSLSLDDEYDKYRHNHFTASDQSTHKINKKKRKAKKKSESRQQRRNGKTAVEFYLI